MGPFHWRSRHLRIPEIKRIQTFDDEYELCGNFFDKWRQVGNAVPVRLAQVLAESIYEQYFRYVQFNTRKQLLLKTLYAYIANSSALDDLDCFSMFGTNSFNLVWEKVCAEVMDNQLQKPIGGLRLPVPLAAQYRDLRHKKLIDLIDKPQWSGTTPTGECFVKQTEDTLIPDLVSIVKIDGEYQFIIFDAKYYNIQLEHNKKLRGQPGIESITKQYLYQLAFRPFVEAHQISTVRNCFLMPTASKEIIEKGAVSLAMLSKLGLQDIQVRLLPAETMYRHYIDNAKMDICILNL